MPVISKHTYTSSVILNAEPEAEFGSRDSGLFVTPWEQHARRLEASGCKVYRFNGDWLDLLSVSVDAAFVRGARQMDEFRGWLAAGALSAHTLCAYAKNDQGGKRLPALFRELGLSPESESRDHARHVRAETWTLDRNKAQAWLDHAGRRPVEIFPGVALQTQPGLFSWDKPDVGTALLLEALSAEPVPKARRTADFGCGLGVLSLGIMLLWPNLAPPEGYDADHRAIAAWSANIPSGRAFARDLTDPQPDLAGKFDLIVMNPPFHEGPSADPGIGQAMIRTAIKSLCSGGVLYLAANRHLPYEKILVHAGSHSACILQKNGFKIFRVRK